MKPGTDPMQAANAAPRCTAHSKRTGLPCRNPAVKGWTVCRMHGARGGARPGMENPAFLHGGRTKEAQEMRRMVAGLLREGREAQEQLRQVAGS